MSASLGRRRPVRRFLAVANDPQGPSSLALAWLATVDISPRAQRVGRALAKRTDLAAQ